MPRDPMCALLGLREIALDEARRMLRACLETEAAALAAESAAEAAILRERAVAASLDVGDGPVEAFAAWLPQGRAERDAACARRGAAELATAHARAQLAASRAGVEAVKAAMARKAEAAKQTQARHAQAELDEIGLRNRP